MKQKQQGANGAGASNGWGGHLIPFSALYVIKTLARHSGALL